MKKLVLIITLLISVVGLSQDSKGQSNNLSVFSAVGTYVDFGHEGFSNDGFNIGVSFTHQNKIIYVGAETVFFPDLNNMDYVHIAGKVGLNKEWGRFGTKFRLFAGTRLGLIYRENEGTQYALMGLEAGMQLVVFKNYFIQVTGSTSNKTDSKIWGNEDYHNVKSVDLGIGIRF